VTSVVVCESCSFSMEKFFYFRLVVSSPICFVLAFLCGDFHLDLGI
jgi:hypothetical protein